MGRKKPLGWKGDGLIEYAVIIVLVATVMIAVLALIGQAVTAYENAKNEQVLSQQFAMTLLAQEAGVEPQEVQIVKMVADEFQEFAYILTIAGKKRLGWCSMIEGKAKCFLDPESFAR